MNTKSLMRVSRLAGLLLLLLAGTLSMTSAQGDAKVRFVHVIPGATAIDVYINGTQTIANLDYAGASTYLTAPAGDHTVTVTAAGLQTPLWEQSITLAADDEITYIASSATEPGFEAITDDLSSLPTTTGRLLLVHALAEGPAVNVELTQDVDLNGNVQTAGTALASDMAYNATFGAYDIPAQTYPLAVRAGGADLLPDVPVSLVSGTSHMAVVYGTVDAPAVLLLTAPTIPNEGEGLLRVVHGIVGAPAVDVYVDGTLIVPGLTPQRPTEHIGVPAGEAAVELRAAGTADVLFSTTLPIEAGSAQTAVAVQLADALTVVAFPDNVSLVSGDSAVVSVVNTVPDASLDNMSLGTEITLAENLAAGETAAAATVIPVSDAIDFTLTRGDATGTLSSDSQTLYGGVYYNLIVLDGSAFGAPTLLLAPTALQQSISSAPGDITIDFAAPAVAEAPATDNTADTSTEVVTDPIDPTPIPVDSSEVVSNPTPVPPPPTAAPVVVLPAPEDVEVVGRITLDPGVNLQLRQYPDPNALSLGLAPSGTILGINGREGAPVALVEGELPPPEAADFVDPALFLVDDTDDIDATDTWLNVTYTTPDEGEIVAWVSAIYVDVRTAAGDPFRLADLEPIGRNIPGETLATELTPPPLPEDSVTGIVQNLDPGVNLNIRRTPSSGSEVLARVATGTVLDVQGFNENQDWVYVNFLPAEGGSVTGWVTLQYMDIRLNNEVISLPELQTQFGQYTGEPLYNVIADDVVGTVDGSSIEVSIPTPDPLEDAIVAEVLLDPGSNLQLRRQPDANSESVNLIPSGTRLLVDNRTGTGEWVSVTFEGESGWISSQYISLSFNGQLIDVADVPVIPGEEDELGFSTLP